MELGLNHTQTYDFNGNELGAELFASVRSPQQIGSPAAPALSPDGYPAGPFRLITYASLPALPVTGGGVYKTQFKGLARLNTYHGTVTSKAYDAPTNTTTALISVPTVPIDSEFIDYLDTQSNPLAPVGSPITAVQVARPTYEGSPTPHDFGEFASRNAMAAYGPSSDFGTRRFMDMLGTNAYGWPPIDQNDPSTGTATVPILNTNLTFTVPIRDGAVTTLPWSRRTPGSMPNQSGAYNGTVGSSLERAIRFTNTFRRNGWFCLPDCADADYVRKFMQVLRYGSDGVNPYTQPTSNPKFPPVDPDLCIYLEWSNEIWNKGAFSQAHRTESCAVWEARQGSPIAYDGLTDPSQTADEVASVFRLTARRQAWNTAQMSLIAREVFGDDQMMTRVRPILSGFDAPNDPFLSGGIEFIEDYFGRFLPNPKPLSYFLYGAGSGTYRYWAIADDTGNTSTEAVIAGGLETPALARQQACAAYVRSKGLVPVSYEGGVLTGKDRATDFTTRFNQDIRTAPGVLEHLRDMDAAGYGLMCVFTDWAENYGQSYSAEPRHVAASPRFAAARQFVAGDVVQPTAPIALIPILLHLRAAV